MEYLYYLANASLTRRLVEYLHGEQKPRVRFVSVIHLHNRWVVNLKMKSPLNAQLDGDIKAFLNELGSPYSPPERVKKALVSLAAGQSPVEVMRRYQVVVVSHGSPQCSEIEAFRQQFVKGLGYCPPTLA